MEHNVKIVTGLLVMLLVYCYGAHSAFGAVTLIQTFTEQNIHGDTDFGISVSGAGDVNNDGYDDVIVGAYGYSSNTGRAYIYYGGPSMDNTADVTFTGEGASNYFGRSVSGAGDVNNDGYADVIVGAYGYNSGTGRAYIYFGATGSTMDNTADVTMTGEGISNSFGYSVSGAGDVNNDGYGDVIVGADYYSSETGRAYIYFGGSSMDNTADVTFTGEGTNNSFGISVSSAGDVNNDGYDDVIVGAYKYNSCTGHAYIYLGAAGTTMDNTADVTMTGEGTDDDFGYSVSGAGDVNGDSYDDVIVGAYYYNSNTGRAYIYLGAAGSTMDNTADVTMTGEGTDDNDFGISVSGAGDVNNDGYADVIVGAYGYNLYTGRAYIYFGGSSMDNTADVTFTGEGTDNYFGISVSGAGDVNDDGYDDVIVGAYDYNSGIGRVYVYFGAAGSTMDNTADVTMTRKGYSYFGYSVSGAGDVNDDGYDDVIVGSYWYNTHIGRAYIYFGATGTTMDNTADVTLDGELENSAFGYSVSGAGDVNNDGYDDVIVGAYETGRAYIYLGATGTTMDNTADVEMIGEIVDGTRNDFGWSVSGAGDVNNDGYADVIVGAYRYNSYTGRAYIYYGGSSMDNAADVTFTGEGTDNDFGWSVSGAGDVNGDNFDDVIVGADGYNSETGRAYIYYGATGTTMDNTVDVTLDGEGTYNEFGYSVSGAGDVNNDGYADVIVGAYEYSLNGKAYVYGGAPDNVLPTMETIAEAQGQWYMTAPTFSNFGFDDETALDDGWYQMDGFGGVWTPLFTDASGTEWNSDGWAIPGFDALSEGSHTIYFKASDDAGNVGMWSWQFYKDTEPPSIPVLIYPPDSALLVDRTPTFIWHKSTDDVSGVAKYEIMYADNSTFSGPSKVVKYLTDTTYTPSSDITDDIVYWVVKAIDSIGNNSFWADKWHFTYDSEAPLPPTLVSLIGGIWLDDTLVTCEWTSVTLKGTKEPGTDVHYIFQLDDNPAFTSPFTDTTAATSYAIVLGEGIHYWRVRAYDLAGNQGNFSDTESFGIDVTLPSQPTPVAPPDSAIQNTPTIVFIWNSATDNPSGVDHYVLEYASNRVFWNAASVNVTDTVYVTGTLADSTYWWHVRAVDRAGNESPWSNRWYVTIDTQAPEVSALISPSDSSYINTITPTFVWGAATSTYCLQVGLDTTFDTLVVDTCGLADTFYTVTDSLLFDTLTYHWRVEAIDDAGNHSGYQEHPFMFTIDTIPPPIPTLLLPPDSSFTNDNTPTFVWSLVDSDTFITYCLQVATDTLFDSDSIVIDACNLTDTFYTVTDTLADSIYYWRAEAVDRAANHSGYQTPFMLTVDTQAPIFTLTTVWDDTSFTGPYPISSIITSALAGVDSAFIYYSFDAGTTWASIAMQLTPPDTYEVDIPQVPDSNTVVQYYLEASDLASNIGYDPAGAPDTSYSFVGGATTDEKLGTEEQVMIPTEFALHQNLPNPFSSVTSIQYSVVRPTHIALNIYDIAGNLVKILVNEEKKPGYYTVHWDGKDGQGQRVSPGIYFYRLEAHTGLGTGGFKNTKKLILLK